MYNIHSMVGFMARITYSYMSRNVSTFSCITSIIDTNAGKHGLISGYNPQTSNWTLSCAVLYIIMIVNLYYNNCLWKYLLRWTECHWNFWYCSRWGSNQEGGAWLTTRLVIMYYKGASSELNFARIVNSGWMVNQDYVKCTVGYCTHLLTLKNQLYMHMNMCKHTICMIYLNTNT